MAPKTMLLFFLAVLVAACSGEADPEPDPSSTTPPADPVPPAAEPFEVGQLATLDVPRTESEVSEEEVAEVVAGDRALGLDLFGAVAGDENLMLSPYSIGTALSMVYAGAAGTTGDEIAAVMHLEVEEEVLHSVRNALDRALVASTWEGPEEDTR
ncbi:MAG TPA: serpin family protein, partial [Acidimicrobiia bacterium]|nr:serpin family protein [Acidimicrobiia bacterium]